jgi:phosphonate transport system substrate-binding protein
MRVFSKAGCLLPALLLGLCLPAHSAPSKTTVVMGFNPAENSEIIETNGKKMSDYFKTKAGLDIKMFIATDYTALIEALRSGQIDVAWLPAFSYIKAEQIAKARVLLRAVRMGYADQYSAIITRADKPYKTLDDLKGKNIAWVDPSSASGHIMPKAEMIQKRKLDPDKFFGKQIFAGSHDAVLFAVLNGTVDAGVTFADDPKAKEASWTQFLKPEEQKKIRVLYISDPFPSDTVSTTERFQTAHPDVVDLVYKTLVGMGKDPVGKAIFKALYRIDYLIPAKSKDYDPIRNAAKTLNIH